MVQEQLQEIIERGRRKRIERLEEEERREKQRAEEERKSNEAWHLRKLEESGLPEWMHQFVQTQFTNDKQDLLDKLREDTYALELPGCSKIFFSRSVKLRTTKPIYSNVIVLKADRLWYDDDSDRWYVEHSRISLVDQNDLDEAIAMAAEFGERWHAMNDEVTRNNERGIRPLVPPADIEPKPAAPATQQWIQIPNYGWMRKEAINGIKFALDGETELHTDTSIILVPEASVNELLAALGIEIAE